MGNRDITATSFKLHNENNTTLLLKRYYQSPFCVCNFWLRSHVNFGEMMRQKYIVSNILEEFYGEDMQLQLLWVKEK